MVERRTHTLVQSLQDGTSDIGTLRDELNRRGTPLITATGDGEVLVTFVHIADGEPEAVSIWEPVSWKGPEDRRFTRIAGTPVWHLDWPMRSDLRFSYSIQIHAAGNAIPEQIGDPFNQHIAVDDWDPDRTPAVAIFPDAAILPWMPTTDHPVTGTLHAHTFASTILGNERPVWVSTPEGWSKNSGPYPFIVIFDGEAHHSAPAIRDRLLAEGLIPPLVLVLVNQIGIRDMELTGNPDFSRMIATELVPWAREQYALSGDPADAALNGRSFGGLCSGFTALQHPDVFGNAIMQSPSAWYHPTVTRGYPDGEIPVFAAGTDAQVPTLIAAYADADPAPIRLYHECGRVENGPPPARIWQTFGNRWLHDILRLKGYDTVYTEYAGGHDDAWWRGTWANGILWTFGDR